MKKVISKSILLIILISLFIPSSIAVIINIVDFSQKTLGFGIVSKLESFSHSNGSGSRRHYYVNVGDQVFEGQYNQNKSFSINAGDTVAYRRIDFSNGIRAIQLNGRSIQHYYGVWDFLSLSIVLLFIVGYFYLPGMLKRLRQKQNKELIDDYYMNK